MTDADSRIIIASLIATPGVLFSIWLGLRCWITRRWSPTPAVLTEAQFVTPLWWYNWGRRGLVPRMKYTYEVNGKRISGHRFSAYDPQYFGSVYMRALLKTIGAKACPTELTVFVHPRRPDRAVMRPGFQSWHAISILTANMMLPLPAFAVDLKFI